MTLLTATLLSGRSYSLHVDLALTTTASLKEKLAVTSGIHRYEQRLFVGDTELLDAELGSLAESFLGPSVVINVVRHWEPLPSGALFVALRGELVGQCVYILKREDFVEVNCRDDFGGWSSLYLASLKGLSEVSLAILLRPDFTDINYSGPFGTALHAAAENQLTDLCLAILERADFIAVNALDNCGRSALHIAASKCLKEVCMAILDRADFKLKNTRDEMFRSGKTALSHARRPDCDVVAGSFKRHELVGLLRKRGCRFEPWLEMQAWLACGPVAC